MRLGLINVHVVWMRLATISLSVSLSEPGSIYFEMGIQVSSSPLCKVGEH